MPTQSAPAARYQDAAGTVHDILVRRTPQDAWEILDTTPDAHAPGGHPHRV